MDSAFTPGPWEQSHRQTANGMYSTQVYDASGNEIATCAWYVVETPDGIATSREANARLIAAAPDLLEALEQLLKADNHQSRSWATEAIAKATQ